MPTWANELPAVFEHDGHRFECRLEFLVYEDFVDRVTLHALAQWHVSVDGVHVTDYEAYPHEGPDDIRRRLVRVYELQRDLGMR